MDQFALVESAIQEAGLRALERWSDEAEGKGLEGWLLRVAHNAVVDTLRRDRKKWSFLRKASGSLSRRSQSSTMSSA
jgi:predicted RNA polymerase sigma factor